MELSILDNKTGKIYNDVKLWKKVCEYLNKKIDIEELENYIDLLRFETDLLDFKQSNNNYLEFYIQRKKEIDSDKNKRIIFLKNFNISDIQIPNENYPKEFYDENLRKNILEDQQYKCAICGVFLINPHLHHIDYNKKNCSKENLVFLCSRCHGKTNVNRTIWKNLLIEYKLKKKTIVQ